MTIRPARWYDWLIEGFEEAEAAGSFVARAGRLAWVREQVAAFSAEAR